MTLADMGETRSNQTVYNINYHFVWCPKYRHSVHYSQRDVAATRPTLGKLLLG